MRRKRTATDDGLGSNTGGTSQSVSMRPTAELEHTEISIRKQSFAGCGKLTGKLRPVRRLRMKNHFRLEAWLMALVPVAIVAVGYLSALVIPILLRHGKHFH